MELSFFSWDGALALVKQGGFGFGALVFILVFALQWRGKPLDDASAKLQGKLLFFGTLLAGLGVTASFTETFFGSTPPAAPTPAHLTVTFSPSFKTAKLPTPTLQLLGYPGAKEVFPDTAETLEGGHPVTLKITTDALIEQAAKLQQVSADLLKANEDLTVSGGALSPSDVVRIRDLQNQTRASLTLGDFDAASRASEQIRLGVRKP